ncbi:MAG: hypothetical protein OEW21_05790 [Betaproteobacteria bacterium]|nr:hypothetical protein [Betaproteobacteria bacterium]
MQALEQDPRRVSPLVSLALLAGGTALVLAALNLIALDPARLHAPHWLLFVAGLALNLIGVLRALARRGAECMGVAGMAARATYRRPWFGAATLRFVSSSPRARIRLR